MSWTISKSSKLHRFNRAMGSRFTADELENGCEYFWYTFANVAKTAALLMFIWAVLLIIGGLVGMATGFLVGLKGTLATLYVLPLVGAAVASGIFGLGFLIRKNWGKVTEFARKRNLKESSVGKLAAVSNKKLVSATNITVEFLKAKKEKYCPTLKLVD